jgi:protocatechuate 3,4-dioxygenase beta subunit
MSANQISRRQLLGMSLKAGAVAMTSSFSPVRAETRLKRTPGQVLGPFYPVTKPIDQDADLVMVQGKPGRAQGQVIHVTGRVVTAEGKPAQGARLEIWQANTHGRYAHPSDPNPAPLDPNFEGFAVLVTDAEGRYRFRTIKPGPYPTESDDRWRPPHIHYEVTGHIDKLEPNSLVAAWDIVLPRG